MANDTLPFRSSKTSPYRQTDAMDAKTRGRVKITSGKYAGLLGETLFPIEQVLREKRFTIRGRREPEDRGLRHFCQEESLTSVSGSPEHGADVHRVFDPPLHSS